MKFKLEIDCDNAAFGDGAQEVGAEIARILGEVRDRICHSELDANELFSIRDANGNTCGGFVLVTE